MRYEISALVSIYNAERFIKGRLEDLENQTVADKLEIIIVNSGSKQNEKTVIEEFRQRYSNIVYIETEERETIYKAWNRAIRVASGKYITNANADDRLISYAYERMLKAFEENPDVSLVYACSWVTKHENQTFKTLKPQSLLSARRFDLEALKKGCYIGAFPMWKRELHDKYGYFDEKFESAGDFEFWLRIGTKGEKFLNLYEVLGIYLWSKESIEHSDQGLTIREAKRVMRKYR